MTLKKYKQIFEALDNEKRIEIYQFVLQKIFVSKNDLAKEFNLNRASLNHHLSYLLKAGLIYERPLFLEGRHQIFLIPAMELHPERFVELREDYHQLVDLLDIWFQRNLSSDTWSILLEDFSRLEISLDIVKAIESRLFPSFGKSSSISTGYCYICRAQEPQVSCHICNHLICELHLHRIRREKNKMIILCSNCLEKFFG